MKTTLLILSLLLGFSLSAVSGNYTNSTSGLFSAPSTWVGGVAPSADLDMFTIVTNTVVTYDVDNSLTLGWSNSVVNGELRMTNGKSCYLYMNGTLSGSGLWTIGSASNPVGFTVSNTPSVFFMFNTNKTCTMSGINNLQWFGATNHVLVYYTTNTTTSGSTSIVVPNLSAAITTNDICFIGNTSVTSQTGEYYVVGSVSGNVVTFKQTFGAEINSYPIEVFRTNTPALKGSNSVITFINCPIVALWNKPVRVNNSWITSSRTNVIYGLRVENLQYGLATGSGCSGWTVNNSVANGNNSGGFAYNGCFGWTVNNSVANGNNNGGFAYTTCSGWTVNNSVANGNVTGGFAYTTCSGWTVNNSVANGNVTGGFAYTTCSGWTVNNSVANGNSYGGFAHSTCSGWTVNNSAANGNNFGGFAYNGCSGWTVNNSAANGNYNGGFTYNGCSSWTVNNSFANGNSYGGFAASSCFGWTVNNSVANGNNNGGFAYSGCSSWTVNNSFANGNSYGGFAASSCFGWTVNNSVANGNNTGGFAYTTCSGWTVNNSSSTNAPIDASSQANFYNCSLPSPYIVPSASTVPNVYDGIAWIYTSGSAITTNGIITYTLTNNAIESFHQLSLRQGVSRSVSVSVLITNNVGYTAYFGNSSTKTISGSNTGTWTNFYLTAINTNLSYTQFRLSITASATNSTFGKAAITIGQDSIIGVY